MIDEVGVTQKLLVDTLNQQFNQKVAYSSLSNWIRDEEEVSYERLDQLIRICYPGHSLAQCLVLPSEATEQERKFRQIMDVMGGYNPPAILRRDKPKPALKKPIALGAAGKQRDH